MAAPAGQLAWPSFPGLRSPCLWHPTHSPHPAFLSPTTTAIWCRNNEPGLLQKGMTFTIEPMFTLGRPAERYWADKWTAVTADGSLSAQWEHTLLVTDNGVDILTQYE